MKPNNELKDTKMLHKGEGNCRVGDYSPWVSQATRAITPHHIKSGHITHEHQCYDMNYCTVSLLKQPVAKDSRKFYSSENMWRLVTLSHCLIGFISVGDCLLDQPQRQLSLSDNLPGSSYNLHRQCELAFGPGSKPCPYMQPCSKLWCTGKARGQLVCQTRHFPWADGTSCGNSKVCYRGECNDKNSTIHVKVTEKKALPILSILLQIEVLQSLFFFCPRWMGGGGSGVHLETVHGVVVEGFSWPRESVTNLSLRMEANTATGFASNIAPVTSALVLKQVH